MLKDWDNFVDNMRTKALFGGLSRKEARDLLEAYDQKCLELDLANGDKWLCDACGKAFDYTILPAGGIDCDLCADCLSELEAKETTQQNAGKHGCAAQGGDNGAPVGVDYPQDGENASEGLI